jgi:two-component system nitrogen regulation sensor histidine kinase NtrY
VAIPTRHTPWVDTLRKLRRQRRARGLATIGLVVLGPILALATFLILGPLDQGSNDLSLRFILLADVVYILVIAALVLAQVARIVAARRAQSSGSRLRAGFLNVYAMLLGSRWLRPKPMSKSNERA